MAFQLPANANPHEYFFVGFHGTNELAEAAITREGFHSTPYVNNPDFAGVYVNLDRDVAQGYAVDHMDEQGRRYRGVLLHVYVRRNVSVGDYKDMTDMSHPHACRNKLDRAPDAPLDWLAPTDHAHYYDGTEPRR